MTRTDLNPAVFQPLLDAAVTLLTGAWQALAAMGGVLAAYWAPILWIAFFLFFVRWPDVRTQLKKGAWVGVVLLYALAVITWGLCSTPTFPSLAGRISAPWGNIGEKAAFGLAAIAVAFLCGQLQDHWGLTPPEIEIAGPPEGEASDHGHGAHGHH